VDLYINGKIDQWYSQQERRDVVFLLNVTDPAAARDMLDRDPLDGRPAQASGPACAALPRPPH